MRNLIVCTLLILFALSAKAGDLRLVGTALAEFSIFKIDVYQISYFRAQDGSEELHLDYKTNVKKKYSIMGWEEGLDPVLKKKPEYKDQYNWILEQVVDLKKGDVYVIKKNKNKVSMFKNANLIGEIDDAIVASMVYEPWIGASPVDKDIKKKLLRNN